MIIAFFDFDGTISTEDSTMDFVSKTFGKKIAARGKRRLVLRIIFFYLKLMSLQQVKEFYLKYFFRGWDYEDFKMKVKHYIENHFPDILIPSAVDKIKWHIGQGHEVAVVSGSNDVFLEDFCKDLGIALITNTLEVEEGKITGRLNEQYCFGRGKVALIKTKYNLDEAEYIYAYGNSCGDRKMLSLADEKFYQHFN